MRGFLKFIKEQGVIGLAIGFILGSSIAKIVASLVNDIINPVIGIFLGNAKDLASAYIQIAGAKIMWGSFVNNAIDFFILAFIIYIAAKLLKLDQITSKK
ncbi:MAG: large conductance mechanosensitive channel [Pseudomonadota bacterium]|jgi:large conductance mechanosensitive channel|nr:MscL family protein [Burkholderiales bacterium]MDQ5921471.1 large conductance mechanosensitive channel [Pseudomonadota bacterium]